MHSLLNYDSAPPCIGNLGWFWAILVRPFALLAPNNF